MEGVLDRLGDAVAALTEVDVDVLTDPELHALVVGVERLSAQLTVAAAPLLDRWAQRQVWADNGSKSAAARLSRELGCSKQRAAAQLRRATSLASMPLTAAAGVAGELALDKIDLLTRANSTPRRDLFTRDEHVLVNGIRGLPFHDALRAVRHWEHRSDAALDRDHEEAEAQRDANRLHCSSTLDGMTAVDGMLDPINGAIVSGEIGRLEAEIREADRGAGIERTPAQRRAAALVEMARRSTAKPDGSRPADPLFVIHAGEGTLADLCETANGTVITPAHLTPFLDDAMLEIVLFDGPTTVISVSKQRSFTGALRRAIEARDRYCQHPSGCDVSADLCDVDHIVPFSQGGPTAQWNGRLECPTHNRNSDKHDHGAIPFPPREVTRDDERNARRRWRLRRRGWNLIELPLADLPDWPGLPRAS